MLIPGLIFVVVCVFSFASVFSQVLRRLWWLCCLLENLLNSLIGGSTGVSGKTCSVYWVLKLGNGKKLGTQLDLGLKGRKLGVPPGLLSYSPESESMELGESTGEGLPES